ncbi:hypothetical protein [Streptococcus sp. Marseille-Q5986]|uniref:hypothetical protein n=1 Tax=Streptococcus sp. Marseille-Q5986 TaxID=2972782 RepID=UPI0022645E13|nr:hypothetical protein [Streptococcus sp. Marseille-Q5986]
MSKIFRFIISSIVTLFLASNVVPSLVYASEASNYSQISSLVAEVDKKLSKPLELSEDQIDRLIKEKKSLYPELNEEQMREIAYRVMSPYSSRASVWDGQGVTLSEFAWAFDLIVDTLISGYATLGRYAAKHGVAAARSILSRSAKATAKRVGVLSGFISKIIENVVAVVNIYYNVGYSLAQLIDANDYYKNNGRINAWA